jgi:hypothetical protein
LLDDTSYQGDVANTAPRGQLFQSVQIFLIKTQRNLLGADGANLDIEVL